MPNKRGIGVIGLGMASTPHARALQDLAHRVAVRGVFSPSAERRHAFAERFAMPPADSLEAILDDPEISAVLLLTPPNARQELVARLADAGKAILLEKPVERTTTAASAIVERCTQAGVPLGIVFQHRFRRASQALRRVLEAGELGTLHAVQLSVPWWRGQAYYDEPGRGTYTRDGGGVLISQAIHSLDLMLSLLGPVAEVTALVGTTGLHRMEAEDFVAGGMVFKNGALGALSATTANYPGSSESLSVTGDRGTAKLVAGTLRLDFIDGRHEEIGEPGGSGGGADPMAFPFAWHRDLLADFLDALDAGRAPGVTGHEALDVHRLIDALLLAGRERRAVRVEEIG